ncbi:hypothetical protein Tco_0983892 [Tanacetum coccineum]
MCTYLKNMAGFTHSQLKNKRFDEVQKAFDKTMGWIDSFISMDSEVVKGDKEKDEGSIDDDQEEAEMKKHMEIVVDEEEIAVDAIPLATKPPIIFIWKIIKEGKMGYFQLIRADLVKAKHGNTRPKEAYERVLWGDLKVMFKPDIESDVWYEKGNVKGNGKNQNCDSVNDNIRGDVRNVIKNNDRRGCTYKEFLAYNPKEYDGKGGSYVVELLNPHMRTRSHCSCGTMPWSGLAMLYTLIDFMSWLGMVAATEPSTIQKAVQIARHLTDEALKNGSIKKKFEKRVYRGEPSKDRNERDNNKRTRTGNAFATTANPVRRRIHGFMAPKKISKRSSQEEKSRSLALKVKKEVSDEDSSSSDSEDKECGDPNHLIGECSKPPKNNDQKAFIGRAWSDNGEDEVEKTKDETCLVAQAPDEICLGINLEPDELIKDSGCSKHMTGQICDNKCKVIFTEHDTEIIKDEKVIDDELVEEEAIEVSKTKLIGNEMG